MRIVYVVLTCKAYLATRCRWMRETWMPHVSEEDRILFLSGAADPSQDVVGWDTPDGYDGCPLKIWTFVREMPLEDADWVVLVDDDTFVFPDRLRACLTEYDASLPTWVGKYLGGPIPTMSGGAGIALSRSLYALLRAYLLTTPAVFENIHGDVELGRWIMAIPETQTVHHTAFNSHSHWEEGNPQTAITFHYVTEPLARLYGRILSGLPPEDALWPSGMKQRGNQGVNARPMFRVPIRSKRV